MARDMADVLHGLEASRRVAWAKYYELRDQTTLEASGHDEYIGGLHYDLAPGEHVGALAALSDPRRTPVELVHDRVAELRAAARRGKSGERA